MKNSSELGPESDIVILSSNGCDRYHRVTVEENQLCEKVKVGDNWEGRCKMCEYYTQMWNSGNPHQARQVKPVERFYYKCLINGKEDNLAVGLTLSKIIGDKVGKFRIIRKLTADFPDYSDSHFVETRKKYRSIEESFEVSKYENL